jgi:hypothetical protein
MIFPKMKWLDITIKKGVLMLQFKKNLLPLCLIGLAACGNGNVLDKTRPEVAATVPADGSSDVKLNRAILVHFDEEIDAATITTTSFLLTDADDNSIAGSVEMDTTNRIAVFTPVENLEADTTYTVTVTEVIEDSHDNNLENNFGWTFTTGSDTDTTSITIESIEPDNGDINVDRNDSVVIVFSETVNPMTLTSSSITIEDADSDSVDVDLSYNVETATLTVDPTNNLTSNTEYTVFVTTDVQDLAGNDLNTEATWTFTTD